MPIFSAFFQKYRNQLPLLISLILALPVLFFQALRFSFPLGYAGMFTLIAEKIARNGFALPMEVPYYGPGGIPLVYPPLALYVFALALKIGISTWAYLRIMPAVFTLLALIPLYYLTLEIADSKSASLMAVVLVITAPAVYYTHVWSAGVVRALALGFCLAGLLFYLRSIRNFSWRNFFLAGLFLGLLLITHWLYVLFAALFGLACLLSEWKLTRVWISAGILLVALMVAAPWLALILERHGLSSLLMASASHRNVDFIVSMQQIADAGKFILGNLAYVTDNWFVTALALPGLILLLFRKKFQLPLAFLLILLMGEASCYTEILAGMLAGVFSAEVLQMLSTQNQLKKDLASRFMLFGAGLVLFALILASALSGISQIAKYEPEIDLDSLALATYVKNNTSPEATYLLVGKINEAEWFPYLLDRTPVFAMWGSEWKGTYAQQLEIMTALRECQLQKNWACMENLQQTQNVSPTLLIIPNQRWLIAQIKDTHLWESLYSNQRYLVWKRQN